MEIVDFVLLGLIVIFACLNIYGWYKYKQIRDIPQEIFDEDSPEYQIKELKRTTTDFAVKFSDIELGDLLGKGSQGEVFKASWAGTKCAVKMVDTREVSVDTIEEFCQEAKILMRLRHPCLTLFMGVCLQDPHLCILTEICDRGSLFDILHDDDGTGAPITWVKCLRIALDVARGMTYLHTFNPPILHRDLKSLNILVGENWEGKVADFGMTRFSDPEEDCMTQCGSPLWMAPEMIKNDPYDEKSDVYSFAICLWELYTRKVPYRELGLAPRQLVLKVVREQLRPTIPKKCPRAFSKLIQKCWHPLARKRPTFPDILETLEKFSKSPKITGHIPNSDKHLPRPVMDLPKETKQEVENLVVDRKAWKIEKVDEIEIGDELIPQDWSKEDDNEPHRRSRGHHLFQAKYRGKDVILNKCRVGSDGWSRKGEGLPESLDPRINEVMRQFCELRHPHLVLFMGAYLEGDSCDLVMERMAKGSLIDIIHDDSVILEWDTILQLLLDGAKGLAYLHGHKPPIPHPDLKTSRLLINENWRVKINGYGFTNLEDRLLDRPALPTVYTPPEILENRAAATKAGNIYSFGVIISEVLTRLPPYDGEKINPSLINRIVNQGERPTIPAGISDEFKHLLEACWHPNPKKRPPLLTIINKLEQFKEEGPPKFVLDDMNAKRYRKANIVEAYRSTDPITVLKGWGKSVGSSGCYVLHAGDGDVYLCERDVFLDTYEPVPDGESYQYRKVGWIYGRHMEEPFTMKGKGGIEQGFAGDYLVQNQEGEQWAIPQSKFETMYIEVETDYDSKHPSRYNFNGTESRSGLRSGMKSTTKSKSRKRNKLKASDWEDNFTGAVPK